MKKKKRIKRRNIQTFKSYLIFLEAHNDRNELLHETAEFLLENKSLTKREKAFKHHFFALYALELAGACGCSEVLPDHLRIDNPAKTQFLIELMSALRRYGILGNMTIKQLARILSCILCSEYSTDGMVNRLKEVHPDYEFVHNAIKQLITDMKKKDSAK